MTTRSKKRVFAGTAVLFIFLAILLSADKIESKEEIAKYASPPVKIPTRVDSVVNQFTNFFETTMDSMESPGAALTIVEKNSIVFTKTYGVKEAGTQDSINDHTVFRLASVSKGFASFLAALMVEDKKISWDDPVKKYFPELSLKDSLTTEQLTIRHLLNHTSGLVPHAYDDRIEDGVSFEEIIPELKNVDICCPVGEVYGYQNVVYSLISPVIKKASGYSFEQLMQKRVFQALSMNDASIGYEDLLSSENYAKPHLYGGNRWHTVEIDENYYKLNPAAGINASICDMSIWLLTLLNGYPEVISHDQLNELFKPSVQTALKWSYTRYWDSLDGKYYGLGWRIYEYNNKRIIYHGGYVKGFRSEIAFCPEEGIGMALLMNSTSKLANHSVPAFFRMYFNKKNS
jgi:beta-lactamase class C